MVNGDKLLKLVYNQTTWTLNHPDALFCPNNITNFQDEELATHIPLNLKS